MADVWDWNSDLYVHNWSEVLLKVKPKKEILIVLCVVLVLQKFHQTEEI